MEQNSLENQISQLESQLVAKKNELVGSESGASEKEIFREVVNSYTPQTQATPSPTSTPATAVSADNQSRALTEEENTKIVGLVQMAFDNGISSAIKTAQSYGDAFFVDKLHDRLADEYYEKLLTARKINPE